MIPTGDSVVKPGDRIILFAVKHAIKKIKDRYIDYLRLYRTLIQTDRYHRHGTKKDVLDDCDSEFSYQDIMNNFDPAGGGSGAGADKAHHIEKHLRCLGPLLIISRCESSGCQDRGNLKGCIPDGIHKAVCIFFPQNP